MIFLEECSSCRSIINLKDAVCPVCRAFQLRIDFDLEDKKMLFFEHLSERRYYCNESLDKLKTNGYNKEYIDNKIKEYNLKEHEIKEEFMRKKEIIENFLLN